MRCLISIIISLMFIVSLVVVSGCKQKSEEEKMLQEITQPEPEKYVPEEERMEEQLFE